VDLKSYVRSQQDRVGAGVCVLLGALALIIGWFGVSGTALSHEQLSYLVSGGLFGIALIGIGATLWLSADLRDEWRKLDRVEEALRAINAEPRDVQEPEDDLDPVIQPESVPLQVAPLAAPARKRATARR
jgi:hypothetical protein